MVRQEPNNQSSLEKYPGSSYHRRFRATSYPNNPTDSILPLSGDHLIALRGDESLSLNLAARGVGLEPDLFPMALFVLFPAAAWTGIVAADRRFGAERRSCDAAGSSGAGWLARRSFGEGGCGRE